MKDTIKFLLILAIPLLLGFALMMYVISIPVDDDPWTGGDPKEVVNSLDL